jgi:hypothetical protein
MPALGLVYFAKDAILSQPLYTDSRSTFHGCKPL